MDKQTDSLVGRVAELNEYAMSDLSVEEQLAGGASVDDLITAGVLYDDYDPDNDPAYSFTPAPTAEEMDKQRELALNAPPVSEEEFKAQLESFTQYSKMAAEYRKQANRRATWT